MARPAHIFVFSYDVQKDSARVKLATLLDEHMNRVQKSVFEARMTANEARQLAAKATHYLGPDGSLRVWCVPETARTLCLAAGGPPLPEQADFWLV
jgi:CRISPR-associated protein Cas2